MPYAGRHYQVGAADAFHDGLLDVLFFADLSKLDLIGYVLKGPGTSAWEDPRIQHFRVRSIVIDTQPAMPLMADGVALGEGLVRINVRRHALAVMVGSIAPTVGSIAPTVGSIAPTVGSIIPTESVKSGDSLEK
jgi:diacylglycerol kinase family enzyme